MIKSKLHRGRYTYQSISTQLHLIVLKFVPGLLFNKQNFKNIASSSKCRVVFNKTKFIQNQNLGYATWYIHQQKMNQFSADFFVFALQNRRWHGKEADVVEQKPCTVQQLKRQFDRLYLIGMFMCCFRHHFIHILNAIFGCLALAYPFIVRK